MEQSRGRKKVVRAAVMVAALVAAMATTGCTGGTLMGPEQGTQSQGQVVSQQGGQAVHPGGQMTKP